MNKMFLLAIVSAFVAANSTPALAAKGGKDSRPEAVRAKEAKEASERAAKSGSNYTGRAVGDLLSSLEKAGLATDWQAKETIQKLAEKDSELLETLNKVADNKNASAEVKALQQVYIDYIVATNGKDTTNVLTTGEASTILKNALIRQAMSWKDTSLKNVTEFYRIVGSEMQRGLSEDAAIQKATAELNISVEDLKRLCNI